MNIDFRTRNFFKGLVLSVCCGLNGCQPDPQQVADKLVDEEFLNGRQKVAAVVFFESGGRYFEPEANSKVDQQILLPLVRQLEEVRPGGVWVVLHKGKVQHAYALLIEIPESTQSADQIEQIIQHADQKFDGAILQQWGHRWLSLDLIDAEAADFLRQTDPNFDLQRPK